MENNYKQISIFTVITIALILAGHSYTLLSFSLLIAFVPLILLLKNALDRNLSVLNWALPLFISLLTAHVFICLTDTSTVNYGIIIYPLGIAFSTSLYWFIQRNVKNSFGLFTLVILWLAFDYALLLTAPDYSQYFIFKPLEHSASIITASTGFMGTTFWGLCSNLMVAYVLYDQSARNYVKLRWLSITYLLVLITAPVWIDSIWGENITGITWQQMHDGYTQVSNDSLNYLPNGEWLGRTCAWVALLLVIYGLVKLKIKK